LDLPDARGVRAFARARRPGVAIPRRRCRDLGQRAVDDRDRSRGPPG